MKFYFRFFFVDHSNIVVGPFDFEFTKFGCNNKNSKNINSNSNNSNNYSATTPLRKCSALVVIMIIRQPAIIIILRTACAHSYGPANTRLHHYTDTKHVRWYYLINIAIFFPSTWTLPKNNCSHAHTYSSRCTIYFLQIIITKQSPIPLRTADKIYAQEAVDPLLSSFFSQKRFLKVYTIEVCWYISASLSILIIERFLFYF